MFKELSCLLFTPRGLKRQDPEVIAHEVKKIVNRRDGKTCQYIDHESERICGSRRRVDVVRIRSALALENLVSYCEAHREYQKISAARSVAPLLALFDPYIDREAG